MKTSLIIISLAAMVGLAGLQFRHHAASAAQGSPSKPGPEHTELATFAGGCFWCMESAFEDVPGVGAVWPGYTGGHGSNPSYGDYAARGFVEAIHVRYDPTRIAYDQLLRVFWRQIDPTDGAGQFADRGPHYRPAIFYHDADQKRLAEQSRDELGRSGRYAKPLATEILPATTFYNAEDDHQDYYKKNPRHYHAYRVGSGRDAYLKQVWGKEPPLQFLKPEPADLKKQLSARQFEMTQQNGTEPPFHNEYWDNHKPGIYVDVVSGKPLFSSLDKFDSGTGWPSFTRLLEPSNIAEKTDRSLFMARTEVRSQHADSHLGHVFDDGPPPTGRRYCINSAALRFIPAADLAQNGYGQYRKLFEK